MGNSVADELKKLLDLVAVERAAKIQALDEMIECALDAIRAEAGADTDAVERHCRELLDKCHEELGECEPAELLCALLGYEEK